MADLKDPSKFFPFFPNHISCSEKVSDETPGAGGGLDDDDVWGDVDDVSLSQNLYF